MKILVIGDSCIDRYVVGDVKRINPESPTVILNPTESLDERPGMAANVLRGFKALAEPDWDVQFLTSPTKATKTRYLDKASGYILLRVDDEEKVAPVRIEDVPKADHYLVSDYAKGFITEDVLRKLSLRSGKTWVDTKLPLNRWSQYIHCAKINAKEFAASQAQGDINWTANLVVTRGGEGMEYWQHGGLRKRYPAVKAEVRDQCGAGDSVFAALVAEYIRTNDWDKAIDYANRAGAIAVSRRGTVVVTKEDLV